MPTHLQYKSASRARTAPTAIRLRRWLTCVGVVLTMFFCPVLSWAAFGDSTAQSTATLASVQNNRLYYLQRSIAGQSLRISSEYGFSINGLPTSTYTDLSPTGGGLSLGGDVDPVSNRSGYDYDISGTVLGLENQVRIADQTVNYGLYYSYSSSELNLNTVEPAPGTEVQSDDNTLTAFARWSSLYLGGYTFVLGSYSFNEISTDNPNFRQSFDGDQKSVYLERGWRYLRESLLCSGLGIWQNPYMAISASDYNSDSLDSVNSSSDSNSPTAISDVDYTSFQFIAGTRLTAEMPFWLLTFYTTAGVAWRHEFLDLQADCIMTADEGTSLIYGNAGGRDWLELNLGIDGSVGTSFSIGADYYLIVNKYTEINAVMGTIRLRF